LKPQIRRFKGPSKKGPCERCGKPGIIRFFVAARLPTWKILCDKDYAELRDKLEKALEKILEEEAAQK